LLHVYLRPFMQKKIRVGAVSYLNTKPLIYGFENGKMKDEIELTLDYPSKLMTSLQKNQLDIALLPVASISSIPNTEIISSYCIASDKQVASVCLFSEVPIEEIQEIYLDYQSRTSVALLRILLRDYWHMRPMLLDADVDYINKIKGKTAGIIIGDRALEHYNHFPYRYDLAEAWFEHTQLPFVFAAWVTNQSLTEDFKKDFNNTIGEGLLHMDDIIASNSMLKYDLKTYFTENISYELNEEKQKGLTMFLKLMEQL
jgi:chorismate dehydratase